MEFYSLLTIVYPLMGHTWSSAFGFPVRMNAERSYKVIRYMTRLRPQKVTVVTEVASKIVRPVLGQW